MRDISSSLFVFFILLFSSCQSRTTKIKKVDTEQNIQSETIPGPNYNYTIEAPENWIIHDTIMDGLRIRFLLAPQSLNSDNPAVNVLIASMEGRNISDFTTRNMNYLQSNMPGITISGRGNIDSSVYNGQWFTYVKEQNDIVRDMINYIIPLNGFAYMITCGTNKGGMSKYRRTFDKIANSFKG